MLFVVSKVVFMHTQIPDKKSGLFIQRHCRLLRLWCPSEVDEFQCNDNWQRKREVLWVKSVTVPLVHHKLHVVCPAMHTEQTHLANIMYFTPLQTLLLSTRTLSIAKYIADLIFYLYNTSSQGIKKQCDFLGRLEKKNLWYGKHNLSRTAL